MNTFIGIDPGAAGGIGIIYGEAVRAINMPLTVQQVSDILKTVTRNRAYHICIEDVHASPQMGVSSAFTFGKHFGCLIGVLVCDLHMHEFVTPQKWQTALNCRTGGDKKVSLERAKELFPDVKVTLKTADALLLAYYGYMKYGK